MTTLTDRPNTALLVIDVQNGVVDQTHNRDDVVTNISKLVDKARAEDVPVVWVQHSDDNLPRDSARWQYVPELSHDATLVADAHTTEDISEYGAPKPELVIAHTNLYWENHQAPGRTAGIVETAEVTF